VADFAKDTFAGTDWQLIQTAGADMGGPIVPHPNEPGNFYIFENRALCRSAGTAYYSGTPASADYSVTADIVIKSSAGSTGVAGRISTTALTMYYAYIEQVTGKVVLAKKINGATTSLGVSSSTYGIGTVSLTLDMVGTTIRALINGVAVASATDSSITAAGKAGIRAPAISDTTTGKHLDNFVATDTSTPPVGRSYALGFVGL
jgi:hypothetical protein